jgi:hypothetical protein
MWQVYTRHTSESDFFSIFFETSKKCKKKIADESCYKLLLQKAKRDNIGNFKLMLLWILAAILGIRRHLESGKTFLLFQLSKFQISILSFLAFKATSVASKQISSNNGGNFFYRSNHVI